MDAYHVEGFWMGLLPELQGLIRAKLDWTSKQMLRMTCTKEVPHVKHTAFFEIFWDAADKGHLGICQWIVEVTETWKIDWEDGSGDRSDDEREGHLFPQAPYKKLLLWDDALYRNHFKLAEWAHGAGLPIRDSCIHHLMINNKLEALKWTFAHGYPLPTYIDPWCQLPLLRWLIEEHEIYPTIATVAQAFQCLPDSDEKALYYLQPEICRRLIDYQFIMEDAVRAGNWECMDFIKAQCPNEFQSTCLCNPILLRLYEQRPEVRFRHWINLDTGQIEDMDSDDDEDIIL
jgi:hypothetical protein